MSAIQLCKGITILPSSKCFRPKFYIAPLYLPYSTNDHDKSISNICWLCLNVSKINYSRWAMKSMINETPEQSSSNTNNRGTRLFRTLQFIQKNLTARINQIRKGLSVKILFFLIGFYCSTAFATVIGQTGDWDILSAGLAVVVVEGIGALMYKGSFRFLKKIKGLIAIFNYWKAGLAMGLFLDAFKYEVDSLFESCVKPFDFCFDILTWFYW